MKILIGKTAQVKNHNGFTLLELMIVIALIGILTLVAFPNFQSLRESQTVYAEANRIKSEIRYMQQLAFDTQNTYTLTYGTPSNKSYKIQQNLSPNPLKSETLENNVVFNSSDTLSIRQDGIPDVSASTTTTITLVKNNAKAEIQILSGGKIEIK